MRSVILVLLMMLSLLTTSARAISPEQVPEPLQPWINWVLEGEEHRQCPFIYNQAEGYQCAWPTQLALDLTDNSGQFRQQWQLYNDSWVALPGNREHWPQQITVNGQPKAVSIKKGRPRIKLPKGQHLVTGQWQWPTLPKNLMLNPATGLLALTINNQPIKKVELDKNGRLWLGENNSNNTTSAPQGDALSLQVFRKISDSIPLQVTTLINLEVAGEQRELLLGPLLLDQQIPLQLDSPLPARLEANGQLRVQVRPGRWSINLVSRHPTNINQLRVPNANAPWPEQEVWVFDAKPQLRLVEVENVTAIDPKQTNLPQAWQQLPAYQIRQGESMGLREIRRGHQNAQPDKLNLRRQLWLDFDGRGYSIQDSITGRMNQGWRLATHPQLILGRVAMDGQDQFITQLEGTNQRGVEVRRGQLNVSADSRYQDEISSLPAVGWNIDLQSLHTQLHLPPGWSLLSASGMDSANTWLQSWTLLDLFLVLIAAVAAFRLWGWQWGLITLVTLSLIWHQAAGFGPPRWIWLHLLAAAALLKVLPAGRFKKVVIGYRNASLLVLLLIAIPFMVDQIRTAMYPQLAHTTPYRHAPEINEAAMDSISSNQVQQAAAELTQQVRTSQRLPSPKASSQPAPLTQIDPNTKVQTGPGMPKWQWNSINLTWNGPVQQDQQIKLVLLSPTVNMILNVLRVLLISLLVLRMTGIRLSRAKAALPKGSVGALILPATLLLPLLLASPTPAQAAIPNEQLLTELKTKLLAPPECLPQCAQIATLDITLDKQQLSAELEIHTQQAVAVPLPVNAQHWLPNKVFVNDNASSALLRQPNGALYVPLPAGIHTVRLTGSLNEQTSIRLPLLLRPHRVTLHAAQAHWTWQGVNDNGVPSAQLTLNKVPAVSSTPTPRKLEPGAPPKFASVERTLRLDLNWNVSTQVRRQSPLGQPMSLAIPLLANESVLTEGVNVKAGKAIIHFSANQQTASWQSRLEKSETLTLKAANTEHWNERWQLDASAIWHITTSELPVIYQQNASGYRLPEWRPWPGETVTLNISRPAGVAGQTLTIDSTKLSLTPGHRAMDANLALQIRSSQGGQHRLQLPNNIKLQSVVINHKNQPLRLQEDNSLIIPLTPGAQDIQISWRHNSGVEPLLTTPVINLNSPSVNNDIDLNLGEDRWVLFTAGPNMGPAVLFWSLLAIIVLLAVGLSRIRFTPLRFHHWLLLGIGLTQIPLWMAFIVVGWLLALGLRQGWQHQSAGKVFNLVQVGLVLLTLLALSVLFFAIQQGLLGLPNMQVSGNRSYGTVLRWYQDRSANSLPQAWVVSVPLLVYRLLMLSWALWLAFALLHWLRWGWECFSQQGLWRPLNIHIDFEGKGKP
ncbi:hypothetical protein [Oceanisphaera pacifica]|uniref:Uncharacterized protein n=1 Tax=Oceanisphaera pacifica TaxID=2818389 RepID=A0ABS3NJB0_9GAMM|nr:hypothetical protein [Oceanisphaera pacifica]MBO1520306.1 hypothetical protein [Oceanisphaera pacifica]